MYRRIALMLTACLTGLVIVLAGALPATAESITRVDRDRQTVAAADNITRVTYSVSKRKLVFVVHLERLRRGTLIKVGAWGTATPDPLWVASARWRRNGQRSLALDFFHPEGEVERLRCPGKKATWTAGRNGRLKVSLPQRCMMGATCYSGYYRFSAVTLDPVAEQPLDSAGHPGVLYPDCH